MALHARPLPSRPTAGARPLAPRPDAPPAVALANPSPVPGASAVPPDPASAVAPSLASRREHMPADAAPRAAPDDRAWYQREPWLAWMLAAFVPLAGGAIAPHGTAVLATPLWLTTSALSALCVLVALALLFRQGLFRSAAPRPAGVARSAGGRPRRR